MKNTMKPDTTAITNNLAVSSHSFFPVNERMFIFKVGDEEKVNYPEWIKSWDGKIDLISLLKKYDEALRIAESSFSSN